MLGTFPGVRGAENQTGVWDAVGQSRLPRFTDGTTAHEELPKYVASSSFAYQTTQFTNFLSRMVEGVRGEWTFTPDGERAMVRWIFELKPLRGRTSNMRRLAAPLWQQYMKAGVYGALRTAEEIRLTRP